MRKQRGTETAELRDHLLRRQVVVDGQLVGPPKSAAGVRLRGMRLEGADLRWADLRNTDLRGAILTDARFDHADLSGADLSGAVLRNARFPGARLFETLFTKSDVAGAAFEQALHIDAAHWSKVANAGAARWPGGVPPREVPCIGPLLRGGLKS